MRTFLVAVCLMLAVPAVADSRHDKIQALMEAQGLLQMWDAQMQLGKEESRKQAQQLMDQLFASIALTPEIEVRLKDATAEFLKACDPPWTAQDIVGVWAEKYGAQFTDQELDGLLTYYNSTLGKKDVAASQTAMPAFTNHFLGLTQPRMEAATRVYVERLQSIVRNVNGPKE